MNLLSSAGLLLLAALASPIAAQDARDLSTPVANANLLGVSPTTINNTIAQGYRLTNIEYRGSGLLGTTFDAVFVQNTGVYATNSWWYYNLTAAQVTANLAANNARLIDLDPYEDLSGNLKFACVMVDNTGSHQRGWLWQYGTTTTALATAANNNNARIIDLDRYTIGTTTYYSAVMIANTGQDQRNWWWYVNVTPLQIGSYLNTNSARLYDLEPHGTGTFDCVMTQGPTTPNWHWWPSLTSADVAYLIGQYGVRPIDLATYTTTAGRRWAMVTINNSNTLTTNVGDRMRGATDGQIGIWLQQMGGANLASLNADTVFEPASTMKTLHHVHAMKRVALGLSPTTPLTVYSQYSAPGSSCPIDSGPFQEPLQTVLQQMMLASDNARTQAVRAYFGETNINATAFALGMTSTGLHHRIGCNDEALLNPNEITLHDLHRLHEAVVNGYLGNQRQAFYDSMRSGLDDLDIDVLIDTEAQALGLPFPTRTSFKALTHMVHKKGAYHLIDSNNNNNTWHDRSEFGWISIPFMTGSSYTPREYGFGVWVNKGSTDSEVITAIYTHGIPELLRPTVRAALLTWNNNLAAVQSVGSGCGIPQYTQAMLGLPWIGHTQPYSASPGYPNSLAIMGVGFSSTSWNGIQLPASLTPYGAFAGCRAYNDIGMTYAGIADAAGVCTFNLPLPNTVAYVGYQYLSQFYTFNGNTFRVSNSLRSTIGF